jgi:hypothetical protein
MTRELFWISIEARQALPAGLFLSGLDCRTPRIRETINP